MMAGCRLYYESPDIRLWHGDCREALAALPDGAVDYIVTDPPYGVKKAGWDGSTPDWWLKDAARASARAVVFSPGTHNLLTFPREIAGKEYRWTLSIHLANGMTRGAFGFGNWIPFLVYAARDFCLQRQTQDATSISIRGQMPDHPSPKPLQAMTWVLSRFAPGSVLDPFCGSGSTLVAARGLGWQADGIECESDYCRVAAERLAQQSLPLEPMTLERIVSQYSLFSENEAVAR